MSSTLSFGDMSGLHTLHTISPDWEGLIERAKPEASIFVTPVWCGAWWRHFGAGELRILTAHTQDGLLSAVLPVQTQRAGTVTVHSLVGDPQVCDYMDATLDTNISAEDLAQLCETKLTAPLSQIDFRRVPEGSRLIQALSILSERAGVSVTVTPEDPPCPVLRLEATWDDYMARLDKKRRHEIRRKLKKMQLGQASDWQIVASSGELEQGLETFFRLHAASSGAKASFMTSQMKSFFRDFATGLQEQDRLRLGILHHFGRPTAATLSFAMNGRYSLYNSGYDYEYVAAYSADYGGFSPGWAAIALAIEDAIRVGALEFDFLSGREDYKRGFGSVVDRLTYRVAISFP